MSETPIEELMERNPCTSYYRQGWLLLEWMDERGWNEEQRKICIHCKTTPGCPGCNDRLLSMWGIGSLSRWNPAAVNMGDPHE